MSDRPSERALAPLQPSPSNGITLSTQNTDDTPNRTRRVACRECRQAKLRCDSLGNGTPCVRCRRLSIGCQVDTGYKRVSKRSKINELAEEVEKLRSAVDKRDRARIPASGPSGDALNFSQAETQNVQPSQSSFPESEFTSPDGQALPIQPPLSSTESLSTSAPATQSRSIEHINLDKYRINDLFQTFFLYYHPYFDILDPEKLPNAFYSLSPLLFWSIVAVASRSYSNDATLYSELAPCVTRLMWRAISTFPQTGAVLQAILLLSTWPFPTSSMSDDPSFVLVSIAKAAAMQLGVHRPEIIQDFRRVKTKLTPDKFQGAVKAWVGVFIASQNVASSIGQSTILYADWVIDAACQPNSKYTIPENLRHHALISRYITRINFTMAENKRSETGYPSDADICILMTLLEHDFADLEASIGPYLSDSHQILLVMASLQLKMYYFFFPPHQDVRKQGLLKAYSISLTLASKTVEAIKKSDFLKYAPHGYSQFLVMAAILIMRIVHSSYSKYVDVGEGKRAFNTINSMFLKDSAGDDDIQSRISKILTNLWSFHQSCTARSVLEEPKLNIKTRFGASLLHDSLWMWREQFGGERDAFQTVAPDVNAPSNTTAVAPQTRPLGIDGNISQANLECQTSPQTNYLPTSPPIEGTNFNFDPQDMDWLWDVGFPSFLPTDFASAQQSPPGWQANPSFF